MFIAKPISYASRSYCQCCPIQGFSGSDLADSYHISLGIVICHFIASVFSIHIPWERFQRDNDSPAGKSHKSFLCLFSSSPNPLEGLEPPWLSKLASFVLIGSICSSPLQEFDPFDRHISLRTALMMITVP